MRGQPPKPESFQKFYFDKVATGEGCGCAERIIDTHEFDRLSRARRPIRRFWPRRGDLRLFLRKAGLLSRD
jgi:hypothetical protein